MRAQVVHELGGVEALRLEDVSAPALEPGHVRVGVEAAGVNFPDALIIQGLYQFRPELPFSPGSEAAGTVLEVAPGVVSVAPGDRVAAFTTHGAMAEELVVGEQAVLPLPDPIDFVTGAAIPMAYGTAYHALVDRARLQAGETLLVTGATGGVGSAAVQIGRQLGARVLAAVGAPSKADVAGALGADEVIVTVEESLRDRVRDLTGGRGADVAFDPVGGDQFEAVLRGMAWEGRLLVVGFASGAIPQAPMNLPLLKGCSVVGVFWGEHARRDPHRNRANLHQVMTWVADGVLRPHVSRVLPLADAGAAIAALGSRQAVGKLVLTMGERGAGPIGAPDPH